MNNLFYTLEQQGKARLAEIQRLIAALTNRHMHWDLRDMTDDEVTVALSDLENEFDELTEAK